MCSFLFFCIGDEPKSGLARDLGDCLQSRNVPFDTSGDLHCFVWQRGNVWRWCPGKKAAVM